MENIHLNLHRSKYRYLGTYIELQTILIFQVSEASSAEVVVQPPQSASSTWIIENNTSSSTTNNMLAEKQQQKQQKQQTPVKKKHQNQIHHNHHNHENVINKMQQAGDATPTKQLPAKLVNGNNNHAAESTGKKSNYLVN